jgi:hypothetical protein
MTIKEAKNIIERAGYKIINESHLMTKAEALSRFNLIVKNEIEEHGYSRDEAIKNLMAQGIDEQSYLAHLVDSENEDLQNC